MKIYLMITMMLFLILQNLSAQTDIETNHRNELKKLINTEGKGSASFKISLKQLENVLLYKYNKKKLEALLYDWTIVDSSIKYSYNEKTKEHDLPIFMLQYYIKVSEQEHFWINININNELSNGIFEIYLISIPENKYNTITLNAISYGYEYKSSKYTGDYYKNTVKKIFFEPYISDYGYCLKMSKY